MELLPSMLLSLNLYGRNLRVAIARKQLSPHYLQRGWVTEVKADSGRVNLLNFLLTLKDKNN
ncbi:MULTISPECIES: hypothetical protein [unclassified Nostoc]|uniref:hypothetical protein n=1 Tax=unclassified Nostoc TaxID=2593658 RepID=UPI002AD4889C|nr:hypothetical protein [Nostoc sp. DedQUE03]MDZ7977079.1 hypothetical protein [Nostoc sp. DedQUE03]MDZ8049725.1 hypothetical protein [Nostoc sp. DedQUE02]